MLLQMRVENGLLVLKSGMRYRALVLPDTDRMTLATLEKIDSLVKEGAVVYGPRPVSSPSLSPSRAPQDGSFTVEKLAQLVWGGCDGVASTEHAYGKGRIAWGKPLAELLGVPPDFESSQPDVLYIHRRLDPDSDLYFVSNQQAVDRRVDCTFRVSGKVPELWHPDTGKVETCVLFHEADGRTTLPIHLDPTGSVFVVFRASGAGVAGLDSFAFQGKKLDDDVSAGLPTLNAAGKPSFLAWKAGSYSVTTAEGKAWKADVAPMPEPLAVDGPWQLEFQPKRGAPANATFEKLISWPDSTDDGVKYFSGAATYRAPLNVPADFLGAGRRAWLDLGDVKNLAEVAVNGKPFGILWKPPFRIDVTDAIVPGQNQLEIKVTNLWPNRLIGDRKLPKEKQIAWVSVQYYKATDALLPSGLLGPVKLIPAQQATLAP